MEELAEQGTRRFTYDGVALRARTGKSVLYRRWPTKDELIVDALASAMPPVELVAGGTLRDDLVAILSQLAGVLDGPAGPAIGSCVSGARAHPALLEAFHSRVVAPRRDVLASRVAQAAAAGEVPAEALNRTLLDVGPHLVLFTYFTSGRAPGPDEVADLVDRVCLPLLATATIRQSAKDPA